MPYVPTDWVDDVTPVDAAHMDHIEQGIVDAHALAVGCEEISLAAQGLIAQTMPRAAASSQQNISSQVINCNALGLRTGDVVTRLHVAVHIAGVGTPPVLLKLGLLDKTFKVLGLSANVATDPMWTSKGVKTVPLLTPVTIPTSDLYYVAYLENGDFVTTPLSLYFSPLASNEFLDFVPGVTSARVACRQGGQTDFQPVGGTQGPMITSGSTHWMAVS